MANFGASNFLDNLYFVNVDSDRTLIEVSRLDGKFRTVLYSTRTESPRSIAVDPVKRFVYWADRGQRPSIHRAQLDGEKRIVLVSEGLVEPRDLVVDPNNHYVYWVDSKRDCAMRVSSEAENGKAEIIRCDLAQPMGLGLKNSRMYWSDRRLNRVFSASSAPGSSDQPKTERSGLKELGDIAVFNADVQPKGAALSVSLIDEFYCFFALVFFIFSAVPMSNDGQSETATLRTTLFRFT